MAHVALKELDESLWQHAAEESETIAGDLESLAEPVPVTVTSRKKTFGFTVTETVQVPDPGHVRRKSGLSARRRQYEEFRSACRAARARATRAGIEPIAVLPSKAWDAICAAGGLYRFEHLTPAGTVTVANPLPSLGAAFVLLAATLAMFWGCCAPASTVHLLVASALALAYVPLMLWMDRAGASAARFWSFFAYTCLPSAAVTLARSVALHGAVTWDDAVLALPVGLLCGVVSILCAGSAYAVLHTKPRLLTAATLRLLPSAAACRLFWPSRCDVSPQALASEEDRAVLHVDFPDPPDDVATLLAAALQHYRQLCVAAVPGAITLGLAEILAPNPVAKDPIIYVREGGLVVILAQFGDFPVEAETVRRISRLDFLP